MGNVNAPGGSVPDGVGLRIFGLGCFAHARKRKMDLSIPEGT